MRTCVLLLCFSLAMLSLAHADWQWIGPAGGNIQELRPDRSNPALWFAVNNGSLYRSTDGGRSWKPAGLRDVGYQGNGYPHDSSVTVTRSGLRVIVLRKGASVSTQIWTSADHGRTFSRLAAVPYTMMKIIDHPEDDRILYATALHAQGIAVSTDGGRRWAAFTNLPLPQQQHPGCGDPYVDAVDIAISPFHSDTLYVSGTLVFACGPESDEESFFVKSSDAGRSWKPATGLEGVRFHADPAYPERLYAMDWKRLLMLTRQGWQEISKQPHLQKLISVPRHENELLAIQSGLPFRSLRSTDFGRTWHAVNLDLQNRMHTIAALDDPYRGVLGATERGGGLYFRDEKHAWTAVNAGFRDSVVTEVQGSSIALYARDGGDFLFTTKNGGERWTNLTFDIPGAGPYGMAVDPTDPSHLIVLSRGIQVSRDGGNRWIQAKLDGGLRTVGRATAIDPQNPKIVYVAKGNSYGLFKSTDGGNTFRTLSPKFTSKGYQDISKILVDPNEGRIVYFVVPFFGIFKSSDGGATVSPAINGISPPCAGCDSNPAIDLTPLAAKDTYLSITTQGKIYRSMDGARQWSFLAQGPVKSEVSVLAAADGIGRHLFCIAGQSPKLYESLDGGETWSELASQFGPQSEVYSITDPRKIPFFAGTNHGVFARQ